MADWGGPSDGNTEYGGELFVNDPTPRRRVDPDHAALDDFFEAHSDWFEAEQKEQARQHRIQKSTEQAQKKGAKAARKAQQLAEPRESFLQRMKTRIARLFRGNNNAFGASRKYHRRSRRHGYRQYYNAAH